MKRVDIATVVGTVAENNELKVLFEDGFETIKDARRHEGRLYGNRVYGNQTLSIEEKVDFSYTVDKINWSYSVVRWDIIEVINETVGGNIVDMVGTDKQVCMRFFNAYKNLI